MQAQPDTRGKGTDAGGQDRDTERDIEDEARTPDVVGQERLRHLLCLSDLGFAGLLGVDVVDVADIQARLLT